MSYSWDWYEKAEKIGLRHVKVQHINADGEAVDYPALCRLPRAMPAREDEFDVLVSFVDEEGWSIRGEEARLLVAEAVARLPGHDLPRIDSIDPIPPA